MGVMLLADAKLSHVLWAGGSVLLLYVVCLISYRIVLHPLAKHPGPLLGKFSSLPLYLAIVQKNKTPMHYEMFKKYGSPFRITTNELIFADMKSWSDIYGQSSNPCLKDPGMYDLFTVTGERNLLNATNWSQHARLKRLLSFAFSLKSLLKSEPIFSARVEEYIRLVISESKRKPIDIYARTHEHYLDIVSQLSFGKSFDCLQGNTNALGDLKAFVTVIPATSFFPILKYLPIPAIREGFKRVARLEDFSRSTVKDFLRKHKDGDPSTKGSFLENLITAEDSETGAKLSMDELVENTIIFLVGGSGTTAAATVWFIWECSRNPNAKGKLLDEIRRAFPDPKVRPTYEQTSNLPYLQAMIEETLRLWGPINGAAPRISPGRVLSGHFVPKGTTVSTLTYATARDPQIFPNPEAFVPERWLDANTDMRNMSRPFHYGPANCIGKHLAEITLTLTLARLYQLFDVEVDSSMTESMMRLKDNGVFEPWGGKMLVRCTPVH